MDELPAHYESAAAHVQRDYSFTGVFGLGFGLNMSHRVRTIVLLSVTAAVGTAVFFVPRVPQPLDYHHFADRRFFLGIPNFFNVASNVPFLLVGTWGLILALRRGEGSRVRFIDPAERLPFVILSAGVALTCFGSAYYHLAPDNGRLVWDRLPMTLGFMSLLSAMLMERVNLRAGLTLLLPLLILGLASVVLWYLSELHGAGDLRIYLMVQFYTILLILIILALFPARYTRGSDLVVAVGIYALAKMFELLDRQILNLGTIISGHTLKHLAAALAVYWIFRMLAHRRPAVAQSLMGK